MNNSPSEFVIRDVPTKTWLFAFVMLGGAAYIYLRNPSQWILAIVLAVISMLLLAIPAVEIYADRAANLMHISRRSLYKKSKQTLAIDDIANIAVAIKYDREDNSRSYRVEISLNNGDIVPIRSAYTSSRKRQEELSKKLSEISGVKDGSKSNVVQTAGLGARQDEFRQQQEEITGVQGDEHTTEGVRWTFETSAIGSLPLSQWHSPDFHLDDSFLFLTQVQVGHKTIPSFLKSATDLLFKGSLRVYGLDESDTPDLATAESIALPDRLKQHYLGFSDEAERATHMLNHWVITPLTGWAEKYTMTNKNVSSQLVVHIGPNGLTMRTPGLINSEYLDDLVSLGVELVRALGGGK